MKIKICKALMRLVATYGAESWMLNEDIAKLLTTIDRKVLRRMFRGIEVDENWRAI